MYTVYTCIYIYTVYIYTHCIYIYTHCIYIYTLYIYIYCNPYKTEFYYVCCRLTRSELALEERTAELHPGTAVHLSVGSLLPDLGSPSGYDILAHQRT